MPVSVLLPHVYREKKDPLDVLAQGLNIAQSIYGLKVDMEKMDDYRSSQDLAKRVREGDPQAIEQSRRESQSKNLITDAQAAQLFGKQKIHEKKPEGVDTLEIQTMNGTRYIEQDVDPTKKDAWTTKDFANAVERGFGVNSSDASGGLKVKGDDGQDYWLTGPQKKAKEEKAQQGRPQAYEDSNGRARIGNWDGKTVIKDEENDAFAVTKKEKTPVRKEGTGGWSKDDTNFITKQKQLFRNNPEVVKSRRLLSSAQHISELLKLGTGPADSTIATEYNKLGLDDTAPTKDQYNQVGGNGWYENMRAFLGQQLDPKNPKFSDPQRTSIDGVAKITGKLKSKEIRDMARRTAKDLAGSSQGISENEWYKILDPDSLINFNDADPFKSGGPAGLNGQVELGKPTINQKFYSPEGKSFQKQEEKKAKGFNPQEYLNKK